MIDQQVRRSGPFRFSQFRRWTVFCLPVLFVSWAAGVESPQSGDPVRVRRVAEAGYVSLIVENERGHDVTLDLTVVV